MKDCRLIDGSLRLCVEYLCRCASVYKLTRIVLCVEDVLHIPMKQKKRRKKVFVRGRETQFASSDVSVLKNVGRESGSCRNRDGAGATHLL